MAGCACPERRAKRGTSSGMRLAALAILVAVAAPAHADDDNFAGATIVYARGTTLYKADPRGRGEAALAQLTSPDVRAIQTDAAGKVLLANVAGTWGWMSLDSTAGVLRPLPCTDGPAQLTENGVDVLCSADDPTAPPSGGAAGRAQVPTGGGSQIIVLA